MSDLNIPGALLEDRAFKQLFPVARDMLIMLYMETDGAERFTVDSGEPGRYFRSSKAQIDGAIMRLERSGLIRRVGEQAVKRARRPRVVWEFKHPSPELQ